MRLWRSTLITLCWLAPAWAHAQAAQAPAPSEGAGQLCTSRNLPGTGLRGEYFAQPQFQGKPLLSRMDLQVDFDELLLWPAELGKNKPKSVRWNGWIRVPVSGVYSFHLSEGQQGEIKVSNAVATTLANNSQKVELVGGRFTPVSIDVPALAAGKPIKLEWTAPHGLRFTVPRGLLYPPTDQAK
jgi:PA14 domain